jgi:hypothetical protein
MQWFRRTYRQQSPTPSAGRRREPGVRPLRLQGALAAAGDTAIRCPEQPVTGLEARASGDRRGVLHGPRLAALLLLGAAVAGVGLATAADAVGGPAAIHTRAARAYWTELTTPPPLTRKDLVESIEAARVYFLNQQLPEGNFTYGLNVLENTPVKDDNQVRQAGAVWGLSSLGRDRHTQATRHGVVRGLDFFFRCSQPLKLGRIAPVYPGADEISTGTVALVSLAIVELCRGEDDYLTATGRGLYDTWLDTYLQYLQHIELDTGGWGKRYLVTLNERDPESSPYFDGETLLLYCKAARYMGRKELIPKIERLGPLLAERYTVAAWQADPTSDDTKGFCQWGCMAFAEHVEAGWQNADVTGDAAMALAWWLIYRHEIETRRGNTGYAVEGLLGAYRVARQRGDAESMQILRGVCERLLSRLISWQIGGPQQDRNHFLTTNRIDPRATGGILSGEEAGFVRIDVVQHQVHAMLMALELLFPEPPGTAPKQPVPPVP